MGAGKVPDARNSLHWAPDAGPAVLPVLRPGRREAWAPWAGLAPPLLALPGLKPPWATSARRTWGGGGFPKLRSTYLGPYDNAGILLFGVHYYYNYHLLLMMMMILLLRLSLFCLLLVLLLV